MKAARTRARNAKHAGTRKHARATPKHHPAAQKRSPAAQQRAKVHVKHLSPKQAKARALSLGDVSCCSASALGRSLRLAGWPVGADDVLALHWAATGGHDTGASIWGVLEVALARGLAGVRPVSFEPVKYEPGFPVCRALAGSLPCLAGSDGRGGAGFGCLWPCRGEQSGSVQRPGDLSTQPISGLLLGLDMPEGSHAVCAGPTGGVWSWGALYDLWPDAVVEEAWRVVWPC